MRCGCKFVCGNFVEGNFVEGKIVFCRLHRSAKSLLKALKHILVIAEHGFPKKSHEGSCSPESGCDASCMEAAMCSLFIRDVHSLIEKVEGKKRR